MVMQYKLKIKMKKKNKLNSFAKRGLINVGFVPSKNTIIFLPFFPPSSPPFIPFLSYYTIVNVAFPL